MIKLPNNRELRSDDDTDAHVLGVVEVGALLGVGRVGFHIKVQRSHTGVYFQDHAEFHLELTNHWWVYGTIMKFNPEKISIIYKSLDTCFKF